MLYLLAELSVTDELALVALILTLIGGFGTLIILTTRIAWSMSALNSDVKVGKEITAKHDIKLDEHGHRITVLETRLDQ